MSLYSFSYIEVVDQAFCFQWFEQLSV